MKLSKGLLLAGMMALSVFAGAKSAQATETASRPVLFIHGFNIFGLGENCKTNWTKMEAGLQASGNTGKMVTIGYYYNDPNCDMNFAPKGSILTPIQDLAKQVAWGIYNNFNANGQSIDVVAHSLGGLITRYALYRVSIGDATYPPFLNIAHVTTMGSPFKGYNEVAALCHVVPVNAQCWQMAPFMPFINELNSPAAREPQGQGGTLWANIGSNANPLDQSDGFVASASATSMHLGAAHTMVMPWHKFVFHTKYTKNATVIQYVANSLVDASATSAKRSLASVVETPEVILDAADVTVSRDIALQDVSEVSESQAPANIAPFTDANGDQAGVQFTKVLVGGMFDAMGIQENDIVRGCSAKNLNTPFENLDSIQTSGKSGKVKLCITRGGKNITRVIQVR